MKKDALKFNEDNKDKPYCRGTTYVGSGRSGAHWENCTSKDICPKYKEWIKAGKPNLNYDEHVDIYSCSVKIFRLCFLFKI